MERHYLVIKDDSEYSYFIKYKKLDGFAFKPLNKVDYDDDVVVAKMVLFKPEFIEKVLKRKIKNKLNQYLALIISSVNDDADACDSGLLGAVLNDLERYRRLIMNNYRKYLEDKYVEILLAKIDMISAELKKRLSYLIYVNSMNNEEELEEIHKRSR